ncbi:hypothetical protein LTS18_004547 [Coniosporium uncinatum]|uniref:Uncharacterized protein n=1 Tax=Coniosporium uncinatum TaxID=93489 RepID=A0ACC3DB78_9PEZI|nr:hypothetical protein LTS18_004547 [Coniosporium uncinatum]
MASDEIIPFDANTYTAEMNAYLMDLNDTIVGANATLDLSPLTEAIATFAAAASDVTALRDQAVSFSDSALIDVVNHKLRDFSRGFVSQGGLPGREFYRHVINAPGQDTGYAPVTYPGITEAVQAGNITLAEEWVGKTARGIVVAAGILSTEGIPAGGYIERG